MEKTAAARSPSPSSSAELQIDLTRAPSRPKAESRLLRAILNEPPVVAPTKMPSEKDPRKKNEPDLVLNTSASVLENAPPVDEESKKKKKKTESAAAAVSDPDVTRLMSPPRPRTRKHTKPARRLFLSPPVATSTPKRRKLSPPPPLQKQQKRKAAEEDEGDDAPPPPPPPQQQELQKRKAAEENDGDDDEDMQLERAWRKARAKKPKYITFELGNFRLEGTRLQRITDVTLPPSMRLKIPADGLAIEGEYFQVVMGHHSIDLPLNGEEYAEGLQNCTCNRVQVEILSSAAIAAVGEELKLLKKLKKWPKLIGGMLDDIEIIEAGLRDVTKDSKVSHVFN